MRGFLFSLFLILISCNLSASSPIFSSGAYDEWHSGKYSMFIHFGLYSELGGVWQNQKITRGYSEQIQSQGGIFSDSYAAVANRFNPKGFSAKEVVMLAKNAGMRSIVFTSKHHDGFCMFKTETTDFNSWEATPVARDFVKELSQACAEEGLRFGLYFSLIDWHYPYAYPISSTNADPITPEHHLYNKAQITELLTNYGPISELWFDMGSLTPEQSKELYDLVHTLQPDCMVSGRLGNNQYDFCVMGDNAFPDATLKTSWQTPASMFSETWGYRSWQERGSIEDKAAEKLRALIGVVSHGGNYLLNIGPKGDGTVVDFEEKVLLKIGDWLKCNGEAIYGTEPFAWGSMNDNVYSTKKDNHIYIFPSEVSSDTVISIPLNGSKLRAASFLDNGEKIKAYTKGTYVYVPISAISRNEFIRPIKLTFNKELKESSASILKPETKELLLKASNATPDNSYSCFDYYNNYKSIIGYNWSFTGVASEFIELSYTKEYIGRDLTLVIDGDTSVVKLSGDNELELKEIDSEWSSTYYSVQRGSFNRNLPARIYDLSAYTEVNNDGQSQDNNIHPSMPSANRYVQSSIKWEEVEVPYLDKATQNNTIYVVREVTVPQDCEQVIEFAAGNGVEVLVNGESVLKHLNEYKEENRHEYLKVSLKKGKNQILVGAYNKWAKQVPLVLNPAENVVYTTKIPLSKKFSPSKVHNISIGAAPGENQHVDIEFSNIEILIK